MNTLEREIIENLCRELEFPYNIDGDVITVYNGNINRNIVRYSWGINNASAKIIADDKAMCYNFLSKYGINAIPHHKFINPSSPHYKGNLIDVLAMVDSLGYKTVLKPNKMGGGRTIIKTTNQPEFDCRFMELLKTHHEIVISPLYNLKKEFRVVILDNEVLLVYEKVKPFVVSDGVKTVATLIEEKYRHISHDLGNDILQMVFPFNNRIELLFQFNLSKGCTPEVINKDNEMFIPLSSTALKVADLLDITFSSIDICITSEDEMIVMEVNAGTMFDKFSQFSLENSKITKEIYRKALIYMMK